jgi:hypothetical protein
VVLAVLLAAIFVVFTSQGTGGQRTENCQCPLYMNGDVLIFYMYITIMC